jgi:hypothetical protein
MLASVLGTPSPLTYWTLSVVSVIAKSVHPDSCILQAVRLNELESSWNALEERAREKTVFFSDCPESTICDLLLASGIPIIFVADDPSDLLSFIVASRGISIEQALTFSSQCLSTLSVLCGGQNVLHIRTKQYAEGIREYVRHLIDFCGFQVSEERFESILGDLITNYESSVDLCVGDEVTRCIPHARMPGSYQVPDSRRWESLNCVALQYAVILHNKLINHLVWPREIFFDGNRPEHFVSGPQSMLGPSRCLIFGPYMHLPRGIWEARVEIEVDGNVSGNEISSDIISCGTPAFAATKSPLPRRGVFAFNMAFEVSEPFLPLEVRIFILQGAIEGVFLLRTVELKRVGVEPQLRKKVGDFRISRRRGCYSAHAV